MKLLTSLLIVLLTATTALAQDYWVFIRTYDRPGLTASDDVGRSKAGDVVLVEKAITGQTPTPSEQAEWLIITISDLTPEDIEFLTTPSLTEQFIEDGSQVIKPKAFRTNKLDFALAKILAKPRFISKPISRDKFISYIKEKTTLDYAKYKTKRQYFAYVQYPLKRIRDAFIPYAYAANDVQKICAVGPNCTDENYNTITAWEDAHDGVLSVIEEADVYDDDGDIDDWVVVDGSTTTTSAYMWVTAPVGERHTGIINTGATIRTTTNTKNVFNVDDNNFRISWMEIDMSGVTTTAYSIIDASAQTGTYINNCLLYDYTTCNTGTGLGCAFSGGSGYMSNNLFANLGGTGEFVFVSVSTAGALYIANNTSFDVDSFYNRPAGNSVPYLSNNFIDDNGGDGDAMGDTDCAGGSNNSTNDGTADDFASCSTGAVINYEMDTVVVNTTTDFHLLSTATGVINAGADLTTTYGGANIDIDNRDRDALGDVWDIGFDEYVASGRRMFLIQ